MQTNDELEQYKAKCTQLEQSLIKLDEWAKKLEEGKNFLEAENAKMKEWVAIVEKNKEEFYEKLQVQIKKNEELEMRLAEVANEKAKINYRLNRILLDPKIKRIVEKKKLDSL